jgi:nucleotide-binding universal stress UspA family protein
MKLAHKKMQALMSNEYLKGVKLTEAVDFDTSASGITEKAKKHEIDLIVMGSTGSSGLEEIMIGSTTEKVARTAESPVLTIKEANKNFAPKNVVFASDFHEEVYPAFAKLKPLLDIYGVKVHLLKVNTPFKDFETTRHINNLMENFVAKTGLTNYTTAIYSDHFVEEGIYHYAQDVKADLIALATHGRRGLSHLFNGSLAEDIINHSHLPILTIRMQHK